MAQFQLTTKEMIDNIDKEGATRKSQFFDSVDVDKSGTIDRSEFDQLYDDIKAEVVQEHAREAKLEKRVSRDRARIRLLVILALGLVIIVGLSVAVNAAVMFALLEATKETSVSENGVLTIKGSNATVEVGNSEMGVDSTGHLVDKSGSSLQVASDSLSVNQATGQITNKAGTVDLAVDLAEHTETADFVARQLVDSATTREKFNKLHVPISDTEFASMRITGFDGRTIPLIVDNVTSAISVFTGTVDANAHYNLKANVRVFYTANPNHPLFVAIGTKPHVSDADVSSLAELDRTEYTAYTTYLPNASQAATINSLISSDLSELSSVAWDSVLPAVPVSASRRALKWWKPPTIALTSVYSAYKLKYSKDFFSSKKRAFSDKLRSPKRGFKAFAATRYPKRNFRGEFKLNGKKVSWSNPPLRKTGSGRRLQSGGDSLEATIETWANDETTDPDAAAILSDSFCTCWEEFWKPGDTSLSYSEWSSLQSTMPAGTDADGTAVGAGDAMQQFMEWVSAQSARRSLADNDHGRRLSDLGCPSDGGHDCHPASSTVSLEDGSTVRMDELTVGTRIHTPTGYEPVVGFLHADKTSSPFYHIIETATRSVAISDKHALLIDGVVTDPTHAKVGQYVNTPAGREVIVSITKRQMDGAYHIITPSGLYYVDGIVASTYVDYIPYAAWRIFGDGYITLRYKLGLPIVPEGEAPVTLFWAIDGLRAAGFADATASRFFWPLISSSVMATELASALGLAAAKAVASPVGAIAAGLAALPVMHSATAKA